MSMYVSAVNVKYPARATVGKDDFVNIIKRVN